MPRAYDDVARRLAADEPRTTLALGGLLSAQGRRRDIKLVSIGPDGRSLCPIVRDEPGVWVAYPLLADPEDAAALAAAIEGSPAIAIEGGSADVDPLLPHLARHVHHHSMERATRPWAPLEWRSPKAVARMANTLDLPALYDLYDGFELGLGRTRKAMRTQLAAAVDRFAVVVFDGDGRLDGAAVATSRTPLFIEWSMMTVRPDVRGHGCAWALMDRAVTMTTAAGLGITGVAGPGNPMTIPPDFGIADLVTHVELSLPDRIKGERRIRRLWFKARRKRQRRSLVRMRPEPGRDTAGP